MIKKNVVIAVLCCMVGSGFAAVPQSSVKKSTDFLRAGLTDKKDLPMVLTRLSMTEDIRLLPIFAKLMQSDDDRVRLLTTSLVSRLADRKAVPLLKNRLAADPSMRVRQEALSQLSRMDALSVDELKNVLATDINDANLQVVAANALSKKGHFDSVRKVLLRLSNSDLPSVSTFASITLLANGDRNQVAKIRKVILDPTTQPEMIIAMLNQIRKEKISGALPVADYLARSQTMSSVKIRAYMAISELDPNASSILLGAINAAEGLSLKINLLRLLAERKDSMAQLKELAKYDSIIGALARFEMARKMKHSKSQAYLEAVMKYGHPILIEYVFNRAGQDIENKKPFKFYIKPITDYILSQKLLSDRITTRHSILAFGIELLGGMKVPEANAAIKKILQRHDNDPLKQLAIVALYSTDNKQLLPLIAPSIKSPYPATKSYAAMILAKFNDPAAIPVLLEIQSSQATTDTDIMTLVDWYLLKFAGNATVNKSVNTVLRSIR